MDKSLDDHAVSFAGCSSAFPVSVDFPPKPGESCCPVRVGSRLAPVLGVLLFRPGVTTMVGNVLPGTSGIPYPISRKPSCRMALHALSSNTTSPLFPFFDVNLGCLSTDPFLRHEASLKVFFLLS